MPAGDIVVWEEKLARAGLRSATVASESLGRARGALLSRMRRLPTPAPAADRAQRRLGTWAGSGVVLLVVLAGVLVVAVAVAVGATTGAGGMS